MIHTDWHLHPPTANEDINRGGTRFVAVLEEKQRLPFPSVSLPCVRGSESEFVDHCKKRKLRQHAERLPGSSQTHGSDQALN